MLNSPPLFAILGDFQNKQYWFTITKPRVRLAENNKKKNTYKCKTLYVSQKHNKSKTIGYIFYFYVGLMLCMALIYYI